MTTRQPGRPPRPKPPPKGTNDPTPPMPQMPPGMPQQQQMPIEQAVEIVQGVVDQMYQTGVFQPSPMQFNALITAWVTIRARALGIGQQGLSVVNDAAQAAAVNGDGAGPE